MSNLDPINPYNIIKELQRQIERLQQENEELKALIPEELLEGRDE